MHIGLYHATTWSGVVYPARYDRWDIMFPGCSSVRSSVRPFIRPSHRYHFVCSAKKNLWLYSTHYDACMEMPTWCRCAPPILLWPWPPFNLFPRSCLTWIFIINLHWGVPLCVQLPAKALTFQQMIIMHVWQCRHDVDVCLLFCFNLDLHLSVLCSCPPTCSTSNCKSSRGYRIHVCVCGSRKPMALTPNRVTY